VAVRLPGSGAFNSVCRDPVEVPAGFPLRDNDGRLEDERSFIYAGGGTGWLWNETAGLTGDWAIRIEVDPMPSTTDAGPCVDVDAGPRDAGGADTGAPDVGSLDAGADAGAPAASSGCGCRAGARSGSAGLAGLGLLALGLFRRRR
jgi:MYXO-CTERM domain-containing protein